MRKGQNAVHLFFQRFRVWNNMHDNKERPKVIKILNLEEGPSPLTIYQIKLHGNGHIIPKTSDLCGSAFCPKGLISYPLPSVPWPVKALP